MVDDPGNCRWCSYRSNGLGEPDAILTPHPLYPALGIDHVNRVGAYRKLFRHHLDDAALGEIRLAIDQNQSPGNARSPDKIARMTGQRREAKRRGRPRKTLDRDAALARQPALDL